VAGWQRDTLRCPRWIATRHAGAPAGRMELDSGLDFEAAGKSACRATAV